MKPFVVLEEVIDLIKENIKYFKPDIDNEHIKMEIINKNKEDELKESCIKINIDVIPEEIIKALSLYASKEVLYLF